MSSEKTSSKKGTETARKIRGLVRKIYKKSKEYKEEGKPVAWVMGAALSEEVLNAMDIAGCYPENYSALCAAKGLEMPYIERAESDGWSRFLCGYARCNYGYCRETVELGMISPEAPDGGMADPDMLVSSGNTCDPRYKWFQGLSKYMNVPTHLIDIPFPHYDRNMEEAMPYHLEYQMSELREFINFCERVTGKKMNYDVLAENADRACQTMKLVQEIYEMRKSVPCPMPSQDWWASGVPFQFRVSDPDSIEYYTLLRDEVKQKMENKIGVIPEEKYRLLWAGLPPWHHMNIFNYFESLGAVIVAELTYFLSWHPGFNPIPTMEPGSDPVKNIAKRNLLRWTSLEKEAKQDAGNYHAQMVLNMLRDYKCDGFVIHLNNSCRVAGFGHLHAANLAWEKYGSPSLVLQSDIIDTREYSDAQMKQRIDAFIELLEASKKDS